MSSPLPAPAECPYDVIIVGSGFSGINMGISLKQAGIANFLILERASEVGGTWRDNTYPGCACDVPSQLYSYSFEPNPDWSSVFSGSAEIQAYIKRCAEKYGLRPHLRFGQNVVSARFDEEAGLWTLRTAAQLTYSARVLVSAAGGLVTPSWPELTGREDYAGPVMHTARWDHEVDLAGKRVAVVGTGASAIQVVPAIQPQVAQLKLFQRTAPWILPKFDRRLRARTKALFRRVPLAQRAMRNAILALSELVFAPMVILDSPLQKGLELLARNNLWQVRDPALRRRLTPSFSIGCKRVLISSDYYPALQKTNVELISDGITGFTARGLRTTDGREVEVDAVVMATGFRVGIAEPPFEMLGLGGRSLTQLWSAAGAKAYKGVAISGMPNFFMMLGPNTGPGHTSVLIYTEAQAAYIAQAVQALLRDDLRHLNVLHDVMTDYHRKLQGRMRYTTWTSGCNSWYLDAHGENHTLFPGLATEYALSLRRFKPEEYESAAWADMTQAAQEPVDCAAFEPLAITGATTP